jgi:hypothetical protein
LDILARVQCFGCKVFQGKVAYLHERPPANWAFVKGDSAGTAEVVSVVAKHDGWHHILHADWTFEFLQKPTLEFLCYVVHLGLRVGTNPSLEPVTKISQFLMSFSIIYGETAVKYKAVQPAFIIWHTYLPLFKDSSWEIPVFCRTMFAFLVL